MYVVYMQGVLCMWSLVCICVCYVCGVCICIWYVYVRYVCVCVGSRRAGNVILITRRQAFKIIIRLSVFYWLAHFFKDGRNSNYSLGDFIFFS